MYTTVLPVGAAALLISLACWGLGSSLVASRQPLVAMLGGWCGFLFLCTIPWVAGFSAQAMRPFFWIFFAAGLGALIRGRHWRELSCAVLCTAVITTFVCAPCLYYSENGLVAYGAHGTDMWGYVSTAEWLYRHSPRDLPDIGQVAMRFNWPWYVLNIGDRPLMYESIACLGVATGVTPVLAYYTYLVALFSSLAMALSRQPQVFRLPHWSLALVPAIAVVFSPVVFLPWISGFAAGSIVGLLVTLAFCAVAVAEEGRARTEALLLALLMLSFCGGLYTPQFMLVGVGLVAVPVAWSGLQLLWRRDWAAFRAARPGWFSTTVFSAAAAVAFATVALSGDPFFGTGTFAWSREVAGEFLGIFGGISPYAWLFYITMEEPDRNPAANPVGAAAFVVLALLFLAIAWRRWRETRDIRVPWLVGLCLACLLRVGGDERATMVKAMPIFGFALVVLLAATSRDLRHWALGLLALAVCGLAFVRSAPEMYKMVHGPYIACTEDNMASLEDEEIWRTMAYLNFREDRDGFDWKKHPKTYTALTCFLPAHYRIRLEKKYGIPSR